MAKRKIGGVLNLRETRGLVRAPARGKANFRDYAGKIAESTSATDSAFAGKSLVMHVRACARKRNQDPVPHRRKPLAHLGHRPHHHRPPPQTRPSPRGRHRRPGHPIRRRYRDRRHRDPARFPCRQIHRRIAPRRQDQRLVFPFLPQKIPQLPPRPRVRRPPLSRRVRPHQTDSRAPRPVGPPLIHGIAHRSAVSPRVSRAETVAATPPPALPCPSAVH